MAKTCVSWTPPLPDDPYWKHHTLPLSGGQRGSLHYVTVASVSKNATGPVVLLLHGFPEFWYEWRRQLPALSQAGYRAIAIDMRGFGRSRVAPGKKLEIGQYTFKQVALDCVELLDSLRVQRAILVGHDWGGATVWQVARRFPDRFSAVASVCSPYRPRSKRYHSPADISLKVPMLKYQEFFGRRGGADAARLFDDNIEKTFAVFLRGPQTPPMSFGDGDFEGAFRTLPAPPELFENRPTFARQELQAYVLEYSQQGGFAEPLCWYCTARLNWEEEKELKPVVSQPALMVTAGQDMILAPEMTRGMEQWVPLLSRAHVEHSGHWVATEAPEQLNRILLSWLSGVAKVGMGNDSASVVNPTPTPISKL